MGKDDRRPSSSGGGGPTASSSSSSSSSHSAGGANKRPRPSYDNKGGDGGPRNYGSKSGSSGSGGYKGTGPSKFVKRAGKAITKDDQQRIKDSKRESHPHGDAIDRMVRLWNELRERRTTAARRHELVGDVMTITKGRVLDLAMRHDTSRAVQGCIKFGLPEQRTALCSEILGKCLDLAKSKHGHQLVEKMLIYGGPLVRQAVAKELRGNMVRLMTHNLGSLVVNTGFNRAWNHSTCWSLFQELYGPEYVHFKEHPIGAKNLSGILAARPAKSKAILESMFFTLSRQAEKGLLSLSVSQRLLSEYMQHAPPEQVVAMVAAVREQILSLVASREGARAACLAFQYATAKERKLMFRTLKGHMLDVACHLHGHMVIIAALEVTDDTRTSGGAVFAELTPHLAYLACHRYGKRVLLALLAPRNRRYFSAYDLSLLEPVSIPSYLVKRKDKAGDGEEGGAAPAPAAAAATGTAKSSSSGPAAAGAAEPAATAASAAAGGVAAATAAVAAAAAAKAPIVLPMGPTAEQKADAEAMALTRTSRKDDNVRRGELLAMIKSHLETVCRTHTAVLARSKHGALVLQEAACLFTSPAAAAAAAATGGKQAASAAATSAAAAAGVLSAIADLVLSEPSAEDIASQVDAMNAGAASASAGNKETTDKLLKESGPAAPSASASAAAAAADSAASSSSSAAAGVDGDGDEAVAVAVAGEEEEEEEGEEGEDGMDEDEEEEEDDEAPEKDREDGAGAFVGGEEEEEDEEDEGWFGEDMLPILEHSPSHLLFKRLLQREAVPRELPATAAAGGKFNNKAEQNIERVTPVFGPILLQKIRGQLVDLVKSNRAAFVVAELASSADKATSAAVAEEIKKGASELKGREETPGMRVLLRIAGVSMPAPAGAASPAAAAAAKGGKGAAAKGAAAKGAAAKAAPAQKAAPKQQQQQQRGGNAGPAAAGAGTKGAKSAGKR